MSLSCGRSQRAHDKDICRGGEYHRLHVQFRPPDDGPVRPETCRGKRITDIVRKQKQCIKLEIKKNELKFIDCNFIKTTVFGRVRKIVKSDYKLPHVCLSASPSVRLSA